MKFKIVTLVVVGVLFYSCATKKVTENITPKAATQEVVTTTLTPGQLYGKNVYVNNCAKCHELFDPKSFTVAEWKPIVARMQKKAKISDADAAAVLDYVSVQL